MKVNQLIILVMFLGMFACESTIRQTPNGLKFRVIKEGVGPQPKPGDVVTYNFRLSDSNDSVWNDTYNSDFPAVSKITDSSRLNHEKGLNQMLRMVSQGDSISVGISVKEYFSKIAKRPMPSWLDTTLTMNYQIRIDSILSFENYRSWVRGLRSKQIQAQLQIDTVIIDNFLNAKRIVAQKDPSGFRYVITKRGKGPNALSKQSVLVNFSGYLLDGKYFESNVKSIAQAKGIYSPEKDYQPLEVIIDRSYVMAGWHFGLKHLNKGAKGTFYFPSTLAYGQQRINNIIIENTILVFDIEVLSIREPLKKSHKNK